jgi:uncharacterized membrane protein YhhN
MPTEKYGWMVLFAVSSFVEMLANLFGWEEIHLIAKPLIMIGLMGHYYSQSPMRSLLFLSALVACWVGDVLLLFQSQNELFFIGGLVAFLIGHLIYIFCYKQLRTAEASKELLGTQKVRFSIPIILAGSGLIVVLYPSLGDLRIPVLVYALVLIVMVLNALFRFGRTNTKSFVLIFFGAISFMMSDAALAINKFSHSFEGAGVLIMFTYCSAQYMIVEGALHHER